MKRKTILPYIKLSSVIALTVVLLSLGLGYFAVSTGGLDPIYYSHVDKVGLSFKNQEYIGTLEDPLGMPWDQWYSTLVLGRGGQSQVQPLSTNEAKARDTWATGQPLWHKLYLRLEPHPVVKLLPKTILPSPLAAVSVWRDNEKKVYPVLFTRDNQEIWLEIPYGTGWFETYMLSTDSAKLYGPFTQPTFGLALEGAQPATITQLSPRDVVWHYINVAGTQTPIPKGQLELTRGGISEATLLLGATATVKNSVVVGEADRVQILGLSPKETVTIEAFHGNKSLGQVPFDKLTGLFKPMNQEGKMTYRVMITTQPQREDVLGAQLVGEQVGTQTFDIEVEMLFKPLVKISEQTQTAGGFFTVTVQRVPEGMMPQLTQTLVDGVIWHRSGRDYTTVVPLDYWEKSGKYNYALKLIKDAKAMEAMKGLDSAPATGNVNAMVGGILEKGTWTIKDRKFSVQKLTVDTEVEASTRSDEAYAEYQKYFLPVRESGIQDQLWEGKFIAPIEGRKTTEYGMRRSVNGSLTTYRHNGIDLAAPTGTPVKASNTGKVAFSMLLKLTGNTVIIDHGRGFFTVYLHMDTLKVKAGESVTKGQVIGTVGSTGFSTGPHLHFTTSYYRTNLDPELIYLWDAK